MGSIVDGPTTGVPTPATMDPHTPLALLISGIVVLSIVATVVVTLLRRRAKNSTGEESATS
jgi:hypothetical protein